MTSAVAVALAVLLGATASTGRLSPTSDLSQNKVTATGSTAARALKDRAADVVNVKDFGAVGNGVADDTAEIQAAVAYALANAKPVYIPAGTYLVSSTITAGSSITIRGDGKSSTLKPTISNGTPVLNFPPGSTRFKLADFVIDSGIDGAGFLDGTVPAQQCIGVRAESNVGVAHSTRFSLDNVFARGMKTGFDLTGFIVTATNVWATSNELGFKGSLLNASDLNLRLENNRKDFQISESYAVLLRQIIAEGGNTLGVSSTIDYCDGVEMAAPYFEGGTPGLRTVPWLTVGGAGQVRQFSITGGTFGGGDGSAYGVPFLALDQVVGARIDARFSMGDRNRNLSTTASTKDLRVGSVTDIGWFHDGSKQLGAAFNYFPNRAFDLWFRGWDGVSATNATLSLESTIRRKGRNALRVTTTAAGGFNVAAFRFTGSVLTALKGKTVRAGAWVWIPAIPAYTEPYDGAGTTWTHYPSVQVSSYNGSVLTTSEASNHNTANGQWNFMTAEFAVQSDATWFEVQVYANQSATAGTGAEYVVVDSITLVEAAVPFSRQLNDDLLDSPLIGSVGLSGNMIAYGAAAPTDVDQSYAVGDTVLNGAAAAGGVAGWRCVAAGSPGTWEVMPVARKGYQIPTYSASMTYDVLASDIFEVKVTDTNPFTINAPTNPIQGQRITIRVRNNAAAGLGAATWNSLFKMAGAWVQPAAASNRSITFHYSGVAWYEESRSAADVPN
jgi:hypothetical protein